MTDSATGTRAGTREWLQLAVLSLAVLLVAIDATVLNLAIPEITADLVPPRPRRCGSSTSTL